VQDQDGAELPAADEQLLLELTERACTGGLQLTGEGGLLGKLTKMVVEGALDDHLGYSRNDPAGRNGGNFRNGYRAKTVLTEAGRVANYQAGVAQPRRAGRYPMRTT
jgi:transposase-like protein